MALADTEILGVTFPGEKVVEGKTLKLNGVETIYGVPGIPITDFGRMAQAAGIRVLSFRHEQKRQFVFERAGRAPFIIIPECLIPPSWKFWSIMP